MIKTFEHTDISKRDDDVNRFTINNEVFAIQTNICVTTIVTTIFYKSKTK